MATRSTALVDDFRSDETDRRLDRLLDLDLPSRFLSLLDLDELLSLRPRLALLFLLFLLLLRDRSDRRLRLLDVDLLLERAISSSKKLCRSSESPSKPRGESPDPGPRRPPYLTLPGCGNAPWIAEFVVLKSFSLFH